MSQTKEHTKTITPAQAKEILKPITTTNLQTAKEELQAKIYAITDTSASDHSIGGDNISTPIVEWAQAKLTESTPKLKEIKIADARIRVCTLISRIPTIAKDTQMDEALKHLPTQKSLVTTFLETNATNIPLADVPANIDAMILAIKTLEQESKDLTEKAFDSYTYKGEHIKEDDKAAALEQARNKIDGDGGLFEECAKALAYILEIEKAYKSEIHKIEAAVAEAKSDNSGDDSDDEETATSTLTKSTFQQMETFSLDKVADHVKIRMGLTPAEKKALLTKEKEAATAQSEALDTTLQELIAQLESTNTALIDTTKQKDGLALQVKLAKIQAKVAASPAKGKSHFASELSEETLTPQQQTLEAKETELSNQHSEIETKIYELLNAKCTSDDLIRTLDAEIAALDSAYDNALEAYNVAKTTYDQQAATIEAGRAEAMAKINAESSNASVALNKASDEATAQNSIQYDEACKEKKASHKDAKVKATQAFIQAQTEAIERAAADASNDLSTHDEDVVAPLQKALRETIAQITAAEKDDLKAMYDTYEKTKSRTNEAFAQKFKQLEKETEIKIAECTNHHDNEIASAQAPVRKAHDDLNAAAKNVGIKVPALDFTIAAPAVNADDDSSDSDSHANEADDVASEAAEDNDDAQSDTTKTTEPAAPVVADDEVAKPAETDLEEIAKTMAAEQTEEEVAPVLPAPTATIAETVETMGNSAPTASDEDFEME